MKNDYGCPAWAELRTPGGKEVASHSLDVADEWPKVVQRKGRFFLRADDEQEQDIGDGSVRMIYVEVSGHVVLK